VDATAEFRDQVGSAEEVFGVLLSEGAQSLVGIARQRPIRGGTRHSGTVDRRILEQDPLLEVPQIGRGLDAELFAQQPASVLIEA
jgi:hypothetical protein